MPETVWVDQCVGQFNIRDKHQCRANRSERGSRQEVNMMCEVEVAKPVPQKKTKN